MNFIKKIAQNQLFKITSLNSLSVVLKIAIGLISSKVIAVFVGPNGLALMGNFRNFVGSLETISTLGSQTGIVKYVAENDKKETEFKKLITTIAITILGLSIILGAFLYFLAAYWNTLIFGSDFNYIFVFKTFAFAMPFYAFSFILVAIINGLGKFKTVIYINTFGNIIGLLVTVFFIIQWQTLGAILAIIITPSLLFFVSLFYISKEIAVFNFIKWRYFDFKVIQNLSHYFLMALVTGILSPIIFLAVRKNIIAQIGITQAGYWEAMTRISSNYLLFVTTILTLYFLPKLAAAKTNNETKKVFWSFYKSILPLFILGVIIIYLLRFFIIKLIFTPAFLPVTTLFFWQILGDIFKIASWILGYQFFAKKLTVAFIVTEIFSLGLFYFSSNYFVSIYNLEGIVMAHCFTYLVYLLVLGVYFRKSLG